MRLITSPASFDEIERLTRDWVARAAPHVHQLSDFQRMALGAMGGVALFDRTQLALPWGVFDELVAELRSFGRFDKLVYVERGGSRVEAESVPFQLLMLVYDRKSDTVSETQLDQALGELRKYLYTDKVTAIARADLFGFHSTGETFALSADVRLAPNGPEDLTPQTLAFMTVEPVVQPRYRLESWATVSYEIGTNATTAEADARTIASLRRNVERTAQLLLIAQDGNFTLAPIDIFYDNWVVPTTGQLRPKRAVIPATFERFDLDPKHLPAIRELLDAAVLVDGSGPGGLRVALSRFSDAHLRPNDADRLIDLMIAAEALFLNDGSTELSFRLATRAAIFLGGSSEVRRASFKSMRDAYRLRSRLVHGAEIPHPELRKSADRVEELLRQAIDRALRLVLAGQSRAVTNWDDFEFLDL